MENLTKKLTLCPYQNCLNIPRIIPKNNLQINIICNEHRESNGKDFEISRYLSLNDNLNTKLICSFCYNSLNENEDFLFCHDLNTFFCIKCYYKINNHEYEFSKNNFSNFWNTCIKHNNPYINYCKTCETSLCKGCNIFLHIGHNIIEIQKKDEKKKKELKHNLEIQDNAFRLVKNIINDSLNKLESELNLKKLILNNYLEFNNNGNSIENLNDIFLPLNQQYKQIIDNLSNNSFGEKLLSLDYYYKMCHSNQENKINNNKDNNNNNSKIKNIKKEKSEENNDNIGMKKLIKEIEAKKNINNITPNSKITPKKNNISTIIEKDINVKKMEMPNSIICMTRLSSGNLALGLSNGRIKIYDTSDINRNHFINEEKNEEGEDIDILLTIEQFQ